MRESDFAQIRLTDETQGALTRQGSKVPVCRIPSQTMKVSFREPRLGYHPKNNEKSQGCGLVVAGVLVV